MIESAIITITKQTKAGAPMFDTINSSELKDYEAKGWREDNPITITSEEAQKFRKEVASDLGKLPKVADIWKHKSTLMAAAEIGMRNHKARKDKPFFTKCNKILQEDLNKKRYTKESWDHLKFVCVRTLKHGKDGFDLLKKVDGVLDG